MTEQKRYLVISDGPAGDSLSWQRSATTDDLRELGYEKSGWIYTTDRLPEPGVLVQFAVRGNNEPHCGYLSTDRSWWFCQRIRNTFARTQVYAWRPLADAPEER